MGLKDKKVAMTIGKRGSGMSILWRSMANRQISKTFEEYFYDIFKRRRRHTQLVFDKDTGELMKPKPAVLKWE